MRRNDQDNKAMHGQWIGQRIQDSPLFSQLESHWAGLTPAYQTGLADLVWTNKLPKPEAVLVVLQATKKFIMAFDEQYPPEKQN